MISEHEWYLIACLVGSSLATFLPRVLPMMYLSTGSLPPVVRDWLSFVPVSIMAALIGTDVFFMDGHFACTPDNLFLVAAVPSLLVAWWSKSFFGTIAFAMGAVALGRWLGW